MHIRIASICALASLLPCATFAHASELKDFAGSWAMRIENRNLFVLTLTADGDQLRGAYDRPAEFSSTGNIFSNIKGTVRHDLVVKATLTNGVLHLTIQNANDAKDQDTYAMTVKADHAEIADEDSDMGVSLDPRTFDRVPAGAAVATGWEPNRTYTSGDSDSPNPEMKAIFDEDQRVRQTSKIDWSVVGKSDAERREQTRKLLAAGALHTGSDFEGAAFVFQHGGTAEDYLLAHTLAMIAVSKGDSTAIWIASATLDRYLEHIKQKQIFGTQYSSDGKNSWTQEPYDRALVSDALRQQLGVPSQAMQAKQLQFFQNQK